MHCLPFVTPELVPSFSGVGVARSLVFCVDINQGHELKVDMLKRDTLSINKEIAGQIFSKIV
jgi:hypothetical protein